MLRQVFVGVVILTGCLIGNTSAQETTQAVSIKRTPLQKVEVPGTSYEVVLGMAEFQPNTTVARHTHPGSLLAYIVEGEFIVVVDGEGERAFKAGESFQVPTGAVHLERTSDKGAKALAVYLVPKGQAIASPITNSGRSENWIIP